MNCLTARAMGRDESTRTGKRGGLRAGNAGRENRECRRGLTMPRGKKKRGKRVIVAKIAYFCHRTGDDPARDMFKNEGVMSLSCVSKA